MSWALLAAAIIMLGLTAARCSQAEAARDNARLQAQRLLHKVGTCEADIKVQARRLDCGCYDIREQTLHCTVHDPDTWAEIESRIQ